MLAIFVSFSVPVDMPGVDDLNYMYVQPHSRLPPTPVLPRPLLSSRLLIMLHHWHPLASLRLVLRQLFIPMPHCRLVVGIALLLLCLGQDMACSLLQMQVLRWDTPVFREATPLLQQAMLVISLHILVLQVGRVVIQTPLASPARLFIPLLRRLRPTTCLSQCLPPLPLAPIPLLLCLARTVLPQPTPMLRPTIPMLHQPVVTPAPRQNHTQSRSLPTLEPLLLIPLRVTMRPRPLTEPQVLETNTLYGGMR